MEIYSGYIEEFWLFFDKKKEDYFLQITLFILTII